MNGARGARGWRAQIRGTLLAFSAISAAGTPVAAHHYFASAFDASKPIVIKGLMARIEWTNPHSHFFLDVTDEKGNVSRWVVETSPPGELVRRGLQRSELKIGDPVVIDGFRALNGSQSILARHIMLSNGTTVSCSLAGDVGP